MSIEAEMSDLQLRIFDLVRSQGWEGRTCDECEAITGLTHQSVSARIHELLNWKPKPLIERRHATRKTRSGRGAAIYVAAGIRAAGEREGKK